MIKHCNHESRIPLCGKCEDQNTIERLRTENTRLQGEVETLEDDLTQLLQHVDIHNSVMSMRCMHRQDGVDEPECNCVGEKDHCGDCPRNDTIDTSEFTTALNPSEAEES